VPAQLPFSSKGAGYAVISRPLATVFVLALAIRLINLALLRGDDAFFAEADALGYWALGAALAKPNSLWPTLWSVTDRMPLYPLLLAGIYKTVGDVPRAVALAQTVIDAGTCTLIAALGALVSPLVGLIAGTLAALSLTLIVFSTQILTDTVFLFFFTAMLLAGAHFLLRPSMGLALLAGIAGGLALATRPAVAALLVAAVPLVFAVSIKNRRGLGLALAAATSFAIAATAPVAPLILRNVIDYRSFSLTSQTGAHLAYWIVPLVKQRADGTPYQATVDRIEARYRQRLENRGANAEANPFRIAELKREVAREEMKQLPLKAYALAWLEGMIVNLAAPVLIADPRVRALPRPSFYNTPGGSLWEKARVYLFADPGLYQLLLIIGLLAVLPFLALEAIGFVMLARTLPWAAALAAGVIAYFLLVNGPVASAKYRVPMEPVLIVLTAIPLARLVERAKPMSGGAI
jgi:hypothetical protein